MYFEQPGVTKINMCSRIPPNKNPANFKIPISNFSNNINVNHKVNVPKP
jgi:hypothetical protein